MGSDGLLPTATAVEDAIRRCQEAEVPAWPGWRWLADTMPPDDAATFAQARPEIASGVIISTPTMLSHAAEAVSAAQFDTAIWVGAVTDTRAALNANAGQDGTLAQVILPHPGTFDRHAAAAMVTAATQAMNDARQRQQAAAQGASDTREMLATLHPFWADIPTTPASP